MFNPERTNRLPGDSEKEYNLTASNEATWELKSDAMDFASHAGHTVTVTGTVNNATAHGAKEEVKDKTMDNPSEHCHLTLTNMKAVSESCSKSGQMRNRKRA